MTNDNLRINTHVRQGRRKRAESLFHHPSASVGLFINLWSLLLTLFWCLSLIFFLFTHCFTLVKITIRHNLEFYLFSLNTVSFYFNQKVIMSLIASSDICEAWFS